MSQGIRRTKGMTGRFIWIPGSQPIPLHPKFGSHPKRLKPAGTRIPVERANLQTVGLHVKMVP